MKIANKAKLLIAGLAVAVAGAMVSPVSAFTVLCPDGSESGDGTLAGCENLTNQNNADNLMPTLNTIINVVIGLIGFLAVVVIIIGGLQYTTSAGDAAKVTKAKNTIMYGIIGLVVALLAYAIVNFVLGNLSGTK